jgi:hypothetical protein
MKEFVCSPKISKLATQFEIEFEPFGYWNKGLVCTDWEFDTMIWDNGFDYIPAPIYHQITEWLRTIHNINIITTPVNTYSISDEKFIWKYISVASTMENSILGNYELYTTDMYDTPTKAIEDCIYMVFSNIL